ncbi:hypothetical protein K8T06_08725, partial [bacterium]|nr:hypothetical protein [bacterium]
MNLSRYEIISEFHRGRRATIFKALDVLSGNFVAVKLLLPGSHRKQQDAFKLSYCAMAECRHSLLLPVLDFGFSKSSDSYYYIMPWVEHVVFEDHRWNLNDLVRLTVQVSQTLVYLHRKGTQYEQLEPDHILWLKKADDEGKHIRLINYGWKTQEVSIYKSKDGSGKPVVRNETDLLSSAEQVQSADIKRLAKLITEIIDKHIDLKATDSTKRAELRGLSKLKNVFYDTSDSRTKVISAWNLVMNLIKVFDDHSYARRPARRVFFAEPPFIGRTKTLTELHNWLNDSKQESIIFL